MKDRGKQKIIDAAIECLKECPIDKMSMRNIAIKAGVTTGSIYHHFKNKDELRLAVMSESLHFSQKLYDDIKHEAELHHDELVKVINESVKDRLNKKEQQILHVLFFSEIVKRKSNIQKVYKNHYNQIMDSVAELLSLTYGIPASETRDIAAIMVATVDGIAMQQALGVDSKDFKHFIDTFVTFFNVSIPHYLELKKAS